jgi:uncharacterized repeat protein (TIGR03803 family)
MIATVRFFTFAKIAFAFALTIVACSGAHGGTKYEVVVNFHGKDGRNPYEGAPTVSRAGDIYVTTANGGPKGYGNVVAIGASGSVTVLYNFKGGVDGQNPYGGVLYDESDGTIFGTTCAGGSHGPGVLYSLSSAGKETVLHSFDGVNDGGCPNDAPVMDKAGNFYGTTSSGGANIRGTVWKVNRHGLLTVLHAFDGSDGTTPYARLIRGEGGLLYGTTIDTVFSISPIGEFTLLHSFNSTSDGSYLYGFLIQDKAGNLYGTTSEGGPAGNGTIFKLSPDGTTTVLHAFGNDSGGSAPYSNLILVDNRLYGTTDYGGDPNCGCGVVFKAGIDGTYHVLHTFTGHPSDGDEPYAGLAMGPNHSLYGDTLRGGIKDAGTVFRLKR